MQVDQHIRACPAIREANGLEPYPQPSVCFSAAVSGTAQVRIYDVSVQPMVELTSGALSGAELTSPTLTGLSNNYVLDMGHANVRAVVDCMTREGLECVVMFEDNGGTGEQRFVRVTCNDADHVVALYPDNAIYALDSSGNTGTQFPAGSIQKPCSLLADACSLLTSRAAGILDISGGTWNGGTDVPTNAKCGAHLKNKVVRARPGYATAWTPNVDIIDCEDTTFLGYNGNLEIKHYGGGGHGAPHKVIGCVAGRYLASAISTRSGAPVFIDCTLTDFFNTASAIGTFSVWTAKFTRCTFEDNLQMSFAHVGSGTAATYTSCVGPFQLNSLTSKTVDINGMIGSPDITLTTGVTGSTINISGAFNSITDNNVSGTPNTINEKQLAHRSNLTANIVNLAAGSITPTEAPNLDVAVSSVSGGAADWTTAEKNQIRQRLSLDGTQANPATAAGDFETLLTNVDAAISTRSTFNAASDTVTVGTNNDKTGYAMAGTLQSLDALDTAQDTQHASTRADIATVDGLVDTLVARLTAARATNLDNLDAASSTLATSSALATVDANVDSLLVRLGADDVAIVKGLLLGNYVLDGGSGSTSAQYDTNGVMTAGRVRVFASSAAASGATLGAANGADSEIARVDVTASAVAGKAYPSTVTGLLT